MAAIRVNMTVEVDQKGNGLCIRTPVPVQLVHERNEWYLECDAPRLTTDGYQSMEEALIAGTRLIGEELQSAVVERPLIVGRITPEGVAGMFR